MVRPPFGRRRPPRGKRSPGPSAKGCSGRGRGAALGETDETAGGAVIILPGGQFRSEALCRAPRAGGRDRLGGQPTRQQRPRPRAAAEHGGPQYVRWPQALAPSPGVFALRCGARDGQAASPGAERLRTVLRVAAGVSRAAPTGGPCQPTLTFAPWPGPVTAPDWPSA